MINGKSVFSYEHSGFSPAAISARRVVILIVTAVYSHVLMYTAEWAGASWRQRKCPSFETAVYSDSNHDLSILRVRHSTAGYGALLWDQVTPVERSCKTRYQGIKGWKANEKMGGWHQQLARLTCNSGQMAAKRRIYGWRLSPLPAYGFVNNCRSRQDIYLDNLKLSAT